MRTRHWTLISLLTVCICSSIPAQQPVQVGLNIEGKNRTLTITANAVVEVEPDLAVLHIGFETPYADSKTAYETGARISQQIVSAIKAMGVEEKSIRSESQRLYPEWGKSRRFRLAQYWTVRVKPEKAALILDAAVSAGASDSGTIDWIVNDERALENQALKDATAKARDKAEALAAGMGVKLGSLIHVSDNVTELRALPVRISAGVAEGSFAPYKRAADKPLQIETNKVSRQATVYAVFAIE